MEMRRGDGAVKFNCGRSPYTLSGSTSRYLEAASPGLGEGPEGASGLPPLDPGAVPFLIGVELVEVVIPSEYVVAVLERKDQ